MKVRLISREPQQLCPQLRSEKHLEELELFVKNRGQSKAKDKVVLEEAPAKPEHVFTKKSYQIQSEFNNSVLKKLKDALEADTSEDRSSLLEEGIELIKQRNKLLVISDKYGWETQGRISTYKFVVPGLSRR